MDESLHVDYGMMDGGMTSIVVCMGCELGIWQHGRNNVLPATGLFGGGGGVMEEEGRGCNRYY